MGRDERASGPTPRDLRRGVAGAAGSLKHQYGEGSQECELWMALSGQFWGFRLHEPKLETGTYRNATTDATTWYVGFRNCLFPCAMHVNDQCLMKLAGLCCLARGPTQATTSRSGSAGACG